MTVVVDASAAVEIALDREHADRFQEILTTADVVLAPDTFPAEVTNVFWKYARFSDLPVEMCQMGIAFCLDLVDDYIDATDVWREVFSEAVKAGHSAYDVFYLIAARRSHAKVVTRDRRMAETATMLGVEIADP